MFANDLILFTEAMKEQSQVIKTCLDRFYWASSQKVNSAKSRIYFSPNTDASVRMDICATLDMLSTDDLGRYLGVPTINGRITKVTYQHVVDLSLIHI